MTAEEKELITHSRMVAFRACRRRHHYAYELGIRPVKQSRPLLVGSALHAWLEQWFRAGGETWLCPVSLEERDPYAAPDPLREVVDAFAVVAAEDVYEAARLRAMVLAYHFRWRLQRWKVLAVETEFRAPLVNPLTNRTSQLYERGGKIDAVIAIEFEDGGPEYEGQWIVEHKSNKGPLDPEALYWQRLRMDPQCSDYWLGAHALGFKPRGIIYDVVCKPAIEPHRATPEDKRKFTQGVGCKLCKGGKGKRGLGYPPADEVVDEGERRACAECAGTGWSEAPALYANMRERDETPGEYGLRCLQLMLAEPDRYLHRHKVVRLDAEMREHLTDGWYTVRALHEQRAAGVYPRNPDACFLYHRPCDYYAVCTRSASIDDPKLFQVTGKHPELRVVNDG